VPHCVVWCGVVWCGVVWYRAAQCPTSPCSQTSALLFEDVRRMRLPIISTSHPGQMARGPITGAISASLDVILAIVFLSVFLIIFFSVRTNMQINPTQAGANVALLGLSIRDSRKVSFSALNAALTGVRSAPRASLTEQDRMQCREMLAAYKVALNKQGSNVLVKKLRLLGKISLAVDACTTLTSPDWRR
jgi:hypothetical protein